jgi:signal transduction histidine kinase
MQHTVSSPALVGADLFDESPALLCTTDRAGTILAANRSFHGVLAPGQSLLGQPLLTLVHPDDHAATAEVMAHLQAEAGTVPLENRCRLPDGTWSGLAWRVRCQADGSALHWAARDETGRQEEDEVVARLLAELERSNTDLAQFAYVASHDLSEPLRMVSSYVQLLADRYQGQLDADADEFIAFAVDGATRMKVLIDDLLAFSRAGGSVVRRPVDCALLVTAALSDLGRVIEESGATVVVDELPTVLGDPAQLALVVQNLLSNALKFVAPGAAPAVHVSAERMGEAWCLSVADNGIGIPAVHRTRVFLMFKRLHGRTEYPGTGIGLALCHKIVTRFGGRIWLEEPTGPGTILRFTVPDVAAPPAAPDGAT